MEIDDGNISKNVIIELLQEYTVYFVLFRKLSSFTKKKAIKDINCIRKKFKISCRNQLSMPYLRAPRIKTIFYLKNRRHNNKLERLLILTLTLWRKWLRVVTRVRRNKKSKYKSNLISSYKIYRKDYKKRE